MRRTVLNSCNEVFKDSNEMFGRLGGFMWRVFHGMLLYGKRVRRGIMQTAKILHPQLGND